VKRLKEALITKAAGGKKFRVLLGVDIERGNSKEKFY